MMIIKENQIRSIPMVQSDNEYATLFKFDNFNNRPQTTTSLCQIRRTKYKKKKDFAYLSASETKKVQILLNVRPHYFLNTQQQTKQRKKSKRRPVNILYIKRLYTPLLCRRPIPLLDSSTVQYNTNETRAKGRTQKQYI